MFEIILTALLWAILGGSVALSDDASFVGDGASVFVNQELSVRMVSEDIHIFYEGAEESRRPWKAECIFEFENLTNRTIKLQMGFPNWQGFGDGMGSDAYAIDRFTSEINGKPVKVQTKILNKKDISSSWMRKGRIATFDGAIVWPVEFSPKQKIKIRNTFSFGGFTSNGPFDVFDHMPQTYPKIKKADEFWSVRKPKASDTDFSNSIVGAVTYIMTTGRTWKGPIGQVHVVIDLPPWLRENPHLMIPLPSGYRLSHDKVSWNFKNYVPKEEITIYYLRHVISPEGKNDNSSDFEYKDQAEAWVKFLSKSTIDTDALDLLISRAKNSEIKGVLEKAKVKLGIKQLPN